LPTTTLDNSSVASTNRVSRAAPAVLAEHLNKSFRLPHRRYSTLKERVLHPRAWRDADELRAVDDASFSVAPGEFFGIVGRNGSGKSTLLKCLAGIYRIDRGRAEVNGRLSPFIELGVGFNPDLTARDNVTINAIMHGLSRRQARERFDEIIAFAELEDFVDLKLKNFSSGMTVRLAFSVAIQVDADVLLIDEVLAVGDAAFQQKCYVEFERMKLDGRTIVLVTHDMGAVQRFCHRAMLIDRGRVLEIGDPNRIALRYNELNFGHLVHTAPDDRYGDQAEAEIKAAWFEDDAGERITTLAQGEPCTICMEVVFHTGLEDPVFAFNLLNEPRHTVFATTSEWSSVRTGSFSAGETASVRVRFENWLSPQRYTVTPSVARAGSGAEALDLRKDLASLLVHGTRRTGGIADVPHTFCVEHR
jgi:ABC-2 type transport system ATP-binding protein